MDLRGWAASLDPHSPQAAMSCSRVFGLKMRFDATKKTTRFKTMPFGNGRERLN